jgi:hypothetical protein
VTNEGHVLPFQVSSEVMFAFGFEHGDRVLSTFGVTAGTRSTVIGVRDGAMWVHVDGAVGAAAVVGYNCRQDFERYNGWMLMERVSPTETVSMAIMTTAGFAEPLRIDPETVVARYGVAHGELVESLLPCEQPTRRSVVAGVDRSGQLYVCYEDPKVAGRFGAAEPVTSVTSTR